MKTKDKTTTIAAGKVVLMQFKDQEGKENKVLALLLSPIVAEDGTFVGSVRTAFATDIATGKYTDIHPAKEANWSLSEVEDRNLIAWFYEQVIRRQYGQTNN